MMYNKSNEKFEEGSHGQSNEAVSYTHLDVYKRQEQYDVCIALEASLVDIVPSAKRARDLIEQVGSDRLKVLLDPANLIANSSEAVSYTHLDVYKRQWYASAKEMLAAHPEIDVVSVTTSGYDNGSMHLSLIHI